MAKQHVPDSINVRGTRRERVTVECTIANGMFGSYIQFIFSGDADDRMMAEETYDGELVDGEHSLSVYALDKEKTIDLKGRNVQRIWDYARRWAVKNAPGLKQLIKREGIEAVAAVIGCTPTTLERKRAAIRPMHETEHTKLKKRWPDYDLQGTVLKNGEKRIANGWM